MTLIRRFRRDLRRILRTIERATAYRTGFDPQLQELVLVLEDKRFTRHVGIDLIAAARAAANLLAGRPRGGASTIDMQLARTVTGYRARTIRRKLYESALAIAARRSASPANILNAYLAVAYFGTGLTGAEAAARRLFGRSVSNLSVDEFAEIAALLVYPLPKIAHPDWRRKVRQRALYGLARRYLVNTRIPRRHTE